MAFRLPRNAVWKQDDGCLYMTAPPCDKPIEHVYRGDAAYDQAGNRYHRFNQRQQSFLSGLMADTGYNAVAVDSRGVGLGFIASGDKSPTKAAPGGPAFSDFNKVVVREALSSNKSTIRCGYRDADGNYSCTERSDIGIMCAKHATQTDVRSGKVEPTVHSLMASMSETQAERKE